MNVQNLAWIRQIPQYGARLYEAFKSVQQSVSTIQQQSNTDPAQQPQSPPGVQNLTVRAENGHFRWAIQDQNVGIRRGIQYRVEYADNPNFVNPQPAGQAGDARNGHIFLGNGKYYFRAHSSYGSSLPGPLVYHGGSGTPTAVQGGGTVPPSTLLASQGTGTGAPGQGGQGPGPVPVRQTRTGFNWCAQGNNPSFGGSTHGYGDFGGGTPGGGGLSQGTVLEGTRADRVANYPAASYGIGTIFFETDTQITNLVEGAGDGTHFWAPWIAETVIGTHASRLIQPSSWYPRGTPWFEEDIGPTYIAEDASGTVNTSGNAITWVTGDQFQTPGWETLAIYIGGVAYIWDTITSATSGTVLGTGPGTLTGATFRMPAGVWNYQNGLAHGLQANEPTGSLGIHDTYYLYYVTDYGHTLYWNGTGWGTPSGGFADGSSSGYMVDGFAGKPYPQAYFVPVTTGGSAQFLLPDGTLATASFPTFTGEEVLRAGSTYNGTPTMASAPTFAGGARTDTDSGTPQLVQAYATGTVISVAAEPHEHPLSNTNAILNVLDIGHGGQESSITLPKYFRI